MTQLDTAARPRRVATAVCTAVLAILGAVSPAAACDICSIYSATEQRETRTGFEIGVGEQFTRFATLRNDGDKVDNPADEYVNSAITQLLFGYNFDPRWGIQLNLPIISRTFRRLHDGAIDRGDETGVGDLSLAGVWRPYSWVGTESVFRLSLFGGLKFPSGSTDRLREELEEPEEPALAHDGDAAHPASIADAHGD